MSENLASIFLEHEHGQIAPWNRNLLLVLLTYMCQGVAPRLAGRGNLYLACLRDIWDPSHQSEDPCRKDEGALWRMGHQCVEVRLRGVGQNGHGDLKSQEYCTKQDQEKRLWLLHVTDILHNVQTWYKEWSADYSTLSKEGKVTQLRWRAALKIFMDTEKILSWYQSLHR